MKTLKARQKPKRSGEPQQNWPNIFFSEINFLFPWLKHFRFFGYVLENVFPVPRVCLWNEREMGAEKEIQQQKKRKEKNYVEEDWRHKKEGFGVPDKCLDNKYFGIWLQFTEKAVSGRVLYHCEIKKNIHIIRYSELCSESCMSKRLKISFVYILFHTPENFLLGK